MVYLRKFKFAVKMTFRVYMKSSRDLFEKGNTLKDYYELFKEFYKNCE